MKYSIKKIILLSIVSLAVATCSSFCFCSEKIAESNLSPIQNINTFDAARTASEMKHSQEEERIKTLDLRGIEIVELFKIISRKLDKNIIPSKNVSGRVNLFLNNVSYEDLLNIVMISQKLAYKEEGENIIIIMTEGEYESLYGKKFTETKKMETLKVKHSSPADVYNALSKLKSDIGTLLLDESSGTIILIDNYETVERMKKAFESMDSPLVTEAFELQYAKVNETKKGINSMLTSGVGKLIVNERTNTLIVSDLPGTLQKIKRAISMIDQETKQVFIEAAIIKVTFSENNTYNKIIDNPSFWGTLFTGSFGENITKSNIADQEIDLKTIENYDIDSIMELIESLGDIQVLSRPKISVTNNEQALMNVVQREPIIVGSSGKDDIDFVDVGIKLSLTPTINREGFITMNLRPAISSVTKTIIENNPRNIIPVITEAETQTTVKIKNDSVLMISGLRDSSIDTGSEIIIFLVPHIIKGTELKTKDLDMLNNFFSQETSSELNSLERQFKPDLLKKRDKDIGGNS